MFFFCRNVGKDFLLQEFKMRKVNGLVSFGKEKLHEFGKEGFQQFLKELVVINLVFLHLSACSYFTFFLIFYLKKE